MCPNIIIGNMVFSSWYTALITGAVISTALAIYLRPKDFCLSRIAILTVALLLFVAGLFGARLLFIILHWQGVAYLISGLFSYRLGFAYFGALLLSVLTVWIYAILKRKKFLELLDYGIAFLMLSQAFMRIGCLMAGCCYGKPTDGLLGAIFRTVDTIPRHATQAYESLLLALIFISSRYLYDKIKSKAGCVSFFSLALYGIGRFFIEAYRTDSVAILNGLTLAQVVCLTLAAVSAIAFIKTYKQP